MAEADELCVVVLGEEQACVVMVTECVMEEADV